MNNVVHRYLEFLNKYNNRASINNLVYIVIITVFE